MEEKNGIISLTDKKIPTIIAYSLQSEKIVIGDEARETGLKGKTSAFNFKLDLGKGDAEFSKAKKYWLAPTGAYDTTTSTITAKEATTIFLKELLKSFEIPEQILIGEPAIREKSWKDNFRRHIRDIFKELEIKATPSFFPEPFAVFQYYRNEYLEKTNNSEIFLVIDIGGGTFNACIIKTTDEGYLSRGGGTNIPLGLRAEECGGNDVDKGLLEIIVQKAKERGINWKDDPFVRAEKEGSNVMLLIEDLKIILSEQIGRSSKISEDHHHIEKEIRIDKGSLHPNQDISVILSGEDLKKVIRSLWRKKWGQILIETINESKEKLRGQKMGFERIDKIIVAGGSSNLPFMEEEICTVLPTLVDKKNIYVAPYLGKSVAAGLAYECMEQIDRNPKLGINKIAPCLMNELYLGFRKSRREKFLSPKIKHEGRLLPKGQLIAEPFIIDEYKLQYEFEMPFDVNDRIFYCFSDQPFDLAADAYSYSPLNPNNDVFSLKTSNRIINKWRLEIEIKKNGIVKPTFIYKEKGRGSNKDGVRIDLPEFGFDNFVLREGNSFIGIDFGTSNSYVVKFLKPFANYKSVDYPVYKVNQKTLEILRSTEREINNYKETNLFAVDKITAFAASQMLQMVFHSNKIEGSPLTKGETEKAIYSQSTIALSKSQLEAYNLERAYQFVLKNFQEYRKEPQNFVRTLNKLILNNIDESAGSFRKKSVSLSGMDHKPPISASVPMHMDKLSDELKQGLNNRSAIEYATAMHTKLVSIHPFVDGNGRTARLLMNAILLDNCIPPIVINFADKQRYLSALEDSNNGDLSPLVEFMIECYEESLNEFKKRIAEDSGQNEIFSKEKVSECELEADVHPQDPINDALKSVGGLGEFDPIAEAMRPKIENQVKKRIETYNIWAKTFEKLKFELKIIVEQFNANVSYKDAGYSIKVVDYDLLSFDKYIDICSGKKASKTWYFALELVHPNGRERHLFFFVKCYRNQIHIHELSPVSLIIARYNSGGHNILKNEPIELREIGISGTDLIFFGDRGIIESANSSSTLKHFIADIIKAYL